MSTTTEALEEGRQAFRAWRWRTAFDALAGADRQMALGAADLDRLGSAAYLTGAMNAAVPAWERAYARYAADAEAGPAVRCAFWLGLTLMLRGEHARGEGWFGRARRLLEEAGTEVVEQGYLQVPVGLRALAGGDPDVAHALFGEVVRIADRFGDPDLTALGTLGQGQALVATGEIERGLAVLDEAMVAVTANEVSPIPAGIVYCAVILACREVFDVSRAQEWTAALSRWCARQPDLQPYRGQCLVHRSELLQLRGEWQDAFSEVQQACDQLADLQGDPVLGMALYQRAELLRLRGNFADAEENYRQANSWGHPAQPGLALLRLAQGRTPDAVAAIRRTLAEAAGAATRAKNLAAYIEIMLACGDLVAAREAVADLGALAADFRSTFLQALADSAHGSILLAEDDPAGASAALRRAWSAWQELDAPYETARVRVMLAQACHELGDHDTARMELDAALWIFDRLGADPATAEARRLAAVEESTAADGLTPREIEVLRLVATGASNRDVARMLIISERTVARHLSNLFIKLDVSSRAAATAYAYDHGLMKHLAD